MLTSILASQAARRGAWDRDILESTPGTAVPEAHAERPGCAAGQFGWYGAASGQGRRAFMTGADACGIQLLVRSISSPLMGDIWLAMHEPQSG